MTAFAHPNRNRPAPAARARLWASAALAALCFAALVACSAVRTPEGWSSGAVSGDAVYIGTMEGELLALDKTAGDTIWKRALPTPEDANRAIYGKPAVAEDNGLILVGGYDGRLYAYDSNGDLAWQERLGGRIVGGPAIYEGLALVGSGGVSSSEDSPGTLSAIDIASNDEIWRVEAGGPIWASPVVADGVAYVGSMDHSVYAVNVADGGEKWRYESGGAVVSQVALHENLVIFGGFDSRLYALNIETGEPVWTFNGSTRWYWAPPVVADGVVYAASLDGTLYALDAETGQLRWTFASGGELVGSPAVVKLPASPNDPDAEDAELIAVPVANGGESKIALLETNGSERQACRIGADIRTSLAASDDLIYFGAVNHTIMALRIKPNGNPDEEWVYVTNADDPYPPGRAKAC